MDRGALWATVDGVTKSGTWLSDKHFHISSQYIKWTDSFFLRKMENIKFIVLDHQKNCFIWYIKKGLKLNIQKTKIMASGPITSWEIYGETLGTASDFIFGGSKITADGDCSHKIKRCLLLRRKHMTNLDSILKSRDIPLPTKVHLVKVMVFPVVMYECESWTIKRVEHQRIDAFELWCWRRLLRVPWTARRSNQSILKEISHGVHWKGWC